MMRVLNLTGTHYSAFAELYCYNHAYPGNLLYMANRIRAKTLIGVHSSNPENIVCDFSKHLMPKAREIYQLENGLLKLKKKLL
jgi:hypothetical protein